ncbi:protein adenylyltransferase SelO [Marinobacterium sediminicola]|uniref:Protein nucleotidyltransferase YdiU n=1 Tax=Marinobacterium sediminicola TaxID=518898 RepID=A0ABY1RVT7_9GAMM|nr:YdiU family protein [Marinobacterium sediminicola]ULG70546.1 YdiU family protein [Marinobacterium sediminicola]SMR69041.1 Uncharacterized conserved protein YdiU, UPF0061 family [Marinobacterium sediminicola]
MCAARSLDSLNFDNSYARLPEHWFQRRKVQPLKHGHLIAFSPEVARLLDLDPCSINSDQLVSYSEGTAHWPGVDPLAMKYTGHQFGVYNPDLGDGRGLLLGEVVNGRGVRYDLHLKGAGKTAFSRFGDGRAVLRSSIREYLAGEAMSGLGIPTTRALCLFGSEQHTMRNGMEPCAMLLRVSPCHIRFGHFEYFFYSGQHEDLRKLADYCLGRFFPHLTESDQPYRAMYREVLERTARLVASWQAYGFVHGVLNTDNMSLIGETFDYGPYTFLDHYEPHHVANKNDHEARYAFSKQPSIVLWNLAALAQAMLPLVERADLETELDRFDGVYQAHYLERMKARLGLLSVEPSDGQLIKDLESIWREQHIDHNRFLRALTEWQLAGDAQYRELLAFCSRPQALVDWLERYRLRTEEEASSPPIRRQQMRSVNPRFILRNYMAEEAIREAHQGDYRPLQDLLPLLRHPSDQHPGFERYAGPRPEWAEALFLTCSS